MQDAPVPPAAAKLAREMAAWSSVDLRVRREYPPTPDGRRIVDRFRLIQGQGRVRLESRIQPFEQPQATYLQVSIRRGGYERTTFQIEEFGRTSPAVLQDRGGRQRHSAVLDDWMSTRPEPIRYWYLGETPLPEVMGDARPLGEAAVLGRPVDGFGFVATWNVNQPRIDRSTAGNQGRREMTYWLDRETGVPLRFEGLGFSWKATAFEEMGGRRLPTRSEFRIRRGPPVGPPAEVVAHATTVESVAFGGERPDSLFRLDEAVDYQPGAVAPGVPAVPLRATYPAPPFEPSAAALAVGLTVAAAAVAYLFWRIWRLGPKRVRSTDGESADSLGDVT